MLRPRRPRPPTLRPRALSPFRAACLVVAVLLGSWVFSKRVSAKSPLPVLAAPVGAPVLAAPAGAQGPAQAAQDDAPPPPKPRGRKAAAAAAAAAAASASAAAAAAAPPEKKADKKDDEKKPETGLDYAVERDDEKDLPDDLSDEQKRALGVGRKGVLIQREGDFRSPFAHPHFGGPATAQVGLVLSNVREFDIQKGSFQADFYVSLSSDKPMPEGLKLIFPNGSEDSSSQLADKPHFKLWRYVGTFHTPIDLRKFPFDTQVLQIEIEAEGLGVDTIVFDADQAHTSFDADFDVSGWSVASLGATTRKHYYPTRFAHDDLYYSRYGFTIGLERFGTSAIFSVYVPALVIVLISLVGLWVPPEEMEVRSNAGAPMLVGAVLFHFSLMQALPATGYMTRADKLMVSVYVSLMLNMLSTWFFFLVDEKHHDLVFRVARTLVPVLTVGVMAGGMLL